MTGCSCDQIKTYLYKRRKEKRRLIEAMPDLLLIPVAVKERGGEVLDTSSCSNFFFKLDHWSLKVNLHLEKGDREYVAPIPNLRAFYGKVVEIWDEHITLSDAPAS